MLYCRGSGDRVHAFTPAALARTSAKPSASLILTICCRIELNSLTLSMLARLKTLLKVG